MNKLSIVIPCYNEAENLPLLVDEINAAMDRNDVEVVLVNNGSVDDSAKVLEKLTKNSPFITVVTVAVNQGYGYGILAGLRSGNGKYLGWMHGDLQTPFKDVLLALSKIESLGEPDDIYVKGLRKGRSFFDQFFTLGMSLFETVLLGKRLSDINAQPNIFHRNFFSLWKDPPRDFSLDLYALYMARVLGLRLIRIPVIFPPRKHGQSHWDVGFMSKVKFIKRTITYSLELRKKIGYTFFKYILAGGMAGCIHLLLLFTFTEILKIHYLVSTSLALFIVFWMSFALQKYWAFAERSSDRIGRQVVQYFVMHSINFLANGALMYIFVSVFGIWYMFSQVLVSLSIAMVTFVVNKKYIFKQTIDD